MSTTHEDYTRDSHRRGPSDKSFGWVFTGAFLVLGLWPVRHHRPVRPVLLILSLLCLLITLTRPSLLHWPNVVWTRLGRLLARIANPIVTGLFFYIVFTPVAMVLRWSGRDLLNLARDTKADTYWIPRRPPPPGSGMVSQF
jgi:Saxitoxin biosynthesis operon protein SxtJ